MSIFNTGQKKKINPFSSVTANKFSFFNSSTIEAVEQHAIYLHRINNGIVSNNRYLFNSITKYMAQVFPVQQCKTMKAKLC